MKDALKKLLGGITILVISTIFFSFKPILGRMAMEQGLMPGPLVVLRLAIALPLFLLTILLLGRFGEMRLTLRQLGYFALASCTGMGGAMIFSFYAIYHLGASVSTLVIFVFPAITTLMAYLINKEAVTGAKKLSLLVSFIGIAFVVLPASGESSPNLSLASGAAGGLAVIGLVYALACATCWAGTQIAFERLLKIKSSLVISVYTTGFMLIFFTLIFGIPPLDLKRETWTVMVLLGTVGWYIPFMLTMYGLKKIGASNASIVQSIGPGVVVLIAWVLLGETLAAWQFFGMALLIFAVYLLKSEAKAFKT